MANKTISMQKVRDIIKLHVEGYSHRQIAKITAVHRRIVKKYIHTLTEGVNAPNEALKLTDIDLARLLKKDAEKPPLSQKQLGVNQFLSYALEELQKKHVTRQLLYQEYCEKYPDCFSYSHFCELLNQASKNKDYSLFQTFEAGEIMMADFAGDKLSYIDKETGEEVKCEVLIVTLGFSGYTFVYALPNQTQDSFIEGLNQALNYFKGTPRVARFDNLKSGVIKADRYEPTFNKVIEMFCSHNGIVPDATRVKKPKDKAQVESHVNIIYRRIYAPLRNTIFYSIQQLNYSINELLQQHNTRPYRGSSKSRLDYYLEERQSLSPLPLQPFTRKYTKKVIVQKNYHIWLGHDERYYSVPYSYVGKEITVVYDSEVVEIFHEEERIALHLRLNKIGRYTTEPEHMPPQHHAVKNGTDPEWLKKQAAAIGENVLVFVERLLNKGLLTPQHFKSCQGILHLALKYSKDRVNKACKRSLEYNNITYKSVLTILQKNLESYTDNDPQIAIPFNPNVRGPQSFL